MMSDTPDPTEENKLIAERRARLALGLAALAIATAVGYA
jgi:hypothetical protein